MNNKEKFAYWVRERRIIRAKKNAGYMKPWTDDKVFQSTYFCNVNREHDRVTTWMRRNFSGGHAEANYMLARFVNKPESLFAMGWPWKEFNASAWHTQMSQKGAWGGAYIVSTNGRAMPKHEYIAGLLERAWLHFEQHPLPSTLLAAHHALTGLQGLGSFMAAQILADLKNTTTHPLSKAKDWSSFSAPGPGSLRGLEWFHEYKVTPRNYQEAIASAREWCHTVDAGLLVGVCNQNLQNCFCEYDKYLRVSTGTGRSKRKYNG